MIMNETNTYIRNVLSVICKTKKLSYEVAICQGHLYVVLDGTLLYYVDLSTKIPSDIIIGFTSDDVLSNPDMIIDGGCYRRVMDTVLRYTRLVNPTTLIYENSVLRENPEFEVILGNKMADGASFFFIDNNDGKLLIPIFSSLLNMNKDDTVGMRVYSNPGLPNNYMVAFDIYKKKIRLNYNMYMRVLDVNKPL